LATPLITIFSAGMPQAMATSNSAAETTSAPVPSAANVRTTEPAELAFTA
jgi:hypothetical protein